MKIAWTFYSASKTTRSPLAGRHPFWTYTWIQSSHLKITWIASPMHWQRCNSNLAEVIPSRNYSTTFGKSQVLMIFRFNTVLPSQPRGKLVPEKLFWLTMTQIWKASRLNVWFQSSSNNLKLVSMIQTKSWIRSQQII